MIYYFWTHVGCVLLRSHPIYKVQFVSVDFPLQTNPWTHHIARAMFFHSGAQRDEFGRNNLPEFIARELTSSFLDPWERPPEGLRELMLSLNDRIVRCLDDFDMERIDFKQSTQRILEL